MHRTWRAAVLGAGPELEDGAGNPVPAFASAGTAGQGWFSALDVDADPPVLQIDYSVGTVIDSQRSFSDYSVGTDNGSLVRNPDDTLSVPPASLAAVPTDQVCWGCHLPGGFQGKRGTVWFDERDVHFKGLNQRNDEDPENDIPDDKSTTCSACHPGGLDHNFAKGNSPYAQFRNEDDWKGFRSCRECFYWRV